MPGTMRGVYTNLTEIRRKVFREVSKLAYESGEKPLEEVAHKMEHLPYTIVPGEIATYRESVFLERAVAGERVRMTMGMPMQGVDHPEQLSEGIEKAAIPEVYYQPPLINIIKFACNACEDNVFRVSNACQGCLAHPCREICPKGAISFVDKKAFIDQEKCIKCGMCEKVCPYHAILHHLRPCAEACGMHAIGSDEHGRADIDYEKCVSCGQCLVNCPFGAIADKSQIFQVITAINQGNEVIATVAPSFVGQFGKGGVGKLREAFKQLGFASLEEVATGADMCTVQEAEDFLDEVPEKLPFMGTSCCPSWSAMAKMEFPDNADAISMALTPMVLSARLIRKNHPKAKIVFVGPCSAKKLEAMRRSVKSEVDFVLTFEELAGMMEAKGIAFESLADDKSDFEASSRDGRGFAVSGGVATAVVNAIHDKHPDLEVKVMAAEGLDNCRAMMKDAVKGKYPGYLLEGMACPGGCVAGAGTLSAINRASAAVKRYAKTATKDVATKNEYNPLIPELAGSVSPEVEIAEVREVQKPRKN
ncbi:4Fe-4S dicluster domain-containing protein [Lancefieldella rimae]|uniref:4Fe-4S dicluster domain-containing protein n=1 Tax=Lancefieldella rimae TaxID=1383 RepID=UPI0028806B4C|nr:4Fe-4S dicluster domain-containing protein [Lancefieldella rimae]